MDYTKKYLEYKEKYISLKNQIKNQTGGSYIRPFGINDGFIVNPVPFIPLAPVFESKGPLLGPIGVIDQSNLLTNVPNTNIYIPIREQIPQIPQIPLYTPTVYYDDDVLGISRKLSKKSSKRNSRKSSRRKYSK
jgi:hypothetical protein